MDCEKARELILTDYIDNEMNDGERKLLTIHFSRCHECKEFFDTVMNTTVKPFASAKKVEPPESIWERVKEAITAEEQKKPGFVASVLEKLKSGFYIPKPALVMSTIMALVLIMALTTTLKFSNKEVLETNREEQAEYSTYSIETPVGALLNNDDGFGTCVEKYFL